MPAVAGSKGEVVQSPKQPISTPNGGQARHLVLVLGDQLDAGSAAFDGFDRQADVVWMAEVAEEAEHVWTTKSHIAIFLSSMRHFRDRLRANGFSVDYREMDDASVDRDNGPYARSSLGAELRRAVEAWKPDRVIVVQPGEWRVQEQLRDVAEQAGVPLEIRPDRHFLCPTEVFEAHAEGRKRLVMATFYREMRRRADVLMEDDEPVGDAWSYDDQNRASFGRQGPGDVPAPIGFETDAITRKVLDLVAERFHDHPGGLEHFDWPVTPEQGQKALTDFVEHRLPNFGSYQDAMWTGEPYLYHSRLSAALNLKLLDPREALKAAERAYVQGQAPLNAVEGFIRQILGWREYVRGIYWRYMPGYADRNALGADLPLPAFYWTGEADMACLRHAIRQTLDYGYAHHIQRLMVTGLFALLLGVEPQQVHEWYLAVYVDAVEWVEMPNTLGMSQFADGGLMATKPYCASGKYVQRMSNYCDDCRYDPGFRSGAGEACPFTTLYWDFLMRHQGRFGENPRMGLQLYNLRRIDEDEKRAIRRQADRVRAQIVASGDGRRPGG
jgi:deoxyribodipyrimidine photolyase-related protein